MNLELERVLQSGICGGNSNVATLGERRWRDNKAVGCGGAVAFSSNKVRETERERESEHGGNGKLIEILEYYEVVVGGGSVLWSMDIRAPDFAPGLVFYFRSYHSDVMGKAKNTVLFKVWKKEKGSRKKICVGVCESNRKFYRGQAPICDH